MIAIGAAVALDLDGSDDACVDPDPDRTKFETALIMLGVDREFLAKYKAGSRRFENRAELKDQMIDITRKSIVRSKRIIAAYQAGQKIGDL